MQPPKSHTPLTALLLLIAVLGMLIGGGRVICHEPDGSVTIESPHSPGSCKSDSLSACETPTSNIQPTTTDIATITDTQSDCTDTPLLTPIVQLRLAKSMPDLAALPAITFTSFLPPPLTPPTPRSLSIIAHRPPQPSPISTIILLV